MRLNVTAGGVIVTDAERIAEYRRITGKDPKLKPGPGVKMQQSYGLCEGYTCGQCENLFRRKFGSVYFKCKLWNMSSSATTDIHKFDPACGKFTLRQEA
jgi:hypothetical protein